MLQWCGSRWMNVVEFDELFNEVNGLMVWNLKENVIEVDGWMLWNLMKCLMKLMDEWCGT